MDVENMHPFCLPFGLCHDATSSSMAADFAHTDSNIGHNNNANITNDGNNNNDKIRSKASSPSDELFRRLNNGTTSSLGLSQSILNDDLIIGSSPSLDESFYSLELDINIGSIDDGSTMLIDENETTTRIGDNEEEDDENDNFKAANDDWYCSQYSLFSPTTTRESLIRTALLANNHVFHQIVDPIDIKSSPTLAQLNLNSNEDPNDGLWDGASLTATKAAANAAAAAAASSSSSASLSSSLSSSSSSTTTATNTDLLSTLSTGTSINTVHMHHSCNHHHHSTQSTCLAVAPFRKPDLHHHQQFTSHHNHHHHHHSHQNHHHLSLSQFSPRCHSLLAAATNSHNNLRPSVTLNQLNTSVDDGQDHQKSSPATFASLQSGGLANQHNQYHHQLQQQQHQHQQRSASPALVTSSSSPLSLSLSGQAGENNRLLDNKLKENIEYLTALLCNGNKQLDGANQHLQQPQPAQATISSTMARSCTTLAHTLSTGPKLLERPYHQLQQQPQPQLQLQPQQQQPQQQLMTTTSCNQQQQSPLLSGYNPTNEAAPCAIGQSPAQLKRPYSDQLFKMIVESSVSAADSTESQISSLSGVGCPASSSPAERLVLHAGHCRLHSPQVNVCSCSATNHQRVQQPATNHPHAANMNVLSSLLNSSRCPQPATNWQVGGAVAGGNFHNMSAGQQQQPVNEVAVVTQPVVTLQQNSSPIPPEGKPITLTPIANHGSIIVQQQQQQQKQQQNNEKKQRVFAQPASPSASSTASSAGTANEIGSLASSSSLAKKQKIGAGQSQQSSSATVSRQQQRSAANAGRSGRPNSMSTDCSLSSHDEGFSSQIDNDDCASGQGGDSDADSDGDDDEVDSDDESFYGDYTNSDLIGASISDNPENKWTLNMGRTRRNGQKRYFWQYNVQSKGPKGTRICSADESEDPFVLPEASDPVFSNDCQVEGVKHSGKARRGDGNDLTPNPRKLLMIGLELKKLGKIINELAPVTDLPMNARNKTRKEKNKLASRACRLKKKAQHEANKIKLYGLQREHQQVVMANLQIRKFLNEALVERDRKEQLSSSGTNKEDLVGNVNLSVKMIAEECSMTVAGQTSDYVNSVLEKVVSGCIDGGLQT